MDGHGLRNDFARHSPLDFDAFRANPSEAVNISFALDDDMPCADAARNFARKVDRRGVVAVQIAAQSAFY